MARLVTFDVTGTCMKVARSVGYQYARIAGEFGLQLDEAILDKGFWTAFKQTNALYPCFGCASSMTSTQWWQKVVDRTLTSAGVNDKTVMLKVGERVYRDFSGPKNWELFPDVHSVLETIKSAEVKMGVISNFDERLGDILTGLGVAKYFDFILTSYKVKYAKPDPKIFELALEKSSIGRTMASSAIHVGDNYELDYLGARSVGMHGLLLHRDKEEPVKEDIDIIHSLMDVTKYL